MIDVEVGLITKLIESKEFGLVKDHQIKPMYFTGDNESVFMFIQEFYMENGEVPTERVMKDRFPHFRFMKKSDSEIGAEEGIHYWCNELRKKVKHRFACEALQDSSEMLNALDTEEALQTLRKKISFIDSEVSVTTMVDVTKNTEDRIEAYKRKEIHKGIEGIETGFRSLDLAIGGLCTETLTTILGKTGAGKSWLQILMGAYCQLQGLRVIQYVTEMSTDIMRDRYEAILYSLMYGNFNYNDFKRGSLDPKTKGQFFSFLREDLPNVEPLFLKTASGVINMRTEIEDLKPDIVFIDGVYMMDDDQGARDDWLRLAHITRDLKKAAKHLKIPICINTQLDINSKGGLSGVRYSKAINEDSDTVIEIVREEAMITDNEAKLIVRKNREGTPASVIVNWNFRPMDFSEIYCESGAPNEDSDNTKVSSPSEPMIGIQKVGYQMSGLSKDNIEDLLQYIGADKVSGWKGDKIRFCCTVHNESNPSAGINLSYVPDGTNTTLQVANCLACGASGSIPRYLHLSMPDKFKNVSQAITFLNRRYGVDLGTKKRSVEGELNLNLKDYDQLTTKEEVRFELPLYKLAPYKSGKETYQYFYDRGLTKDTVKKFMIGRDLENQTVTVPVFWEDNVLCGIVGRFIDPNRPTNSRFKIYEFPKGNTLFPLNHFHSDNGEIILVEGLFDVIYMHQLGYTNTLTTFSNSISPSQIKVLSRLGHSIVDMLDNDERGRKGSNLIRKKLGHNFIWRYVPFPDYGKDPMDWSENDIKYMLSRKSLINI